MTHWKVQMQPPEKAAQELVMENAASAKKHLGQAVEYILFCDFKTKEPISCHTDFLKNMAVVHTHIKERLAKNQKLALHHNHPTGNSLSVADYDIIAEFPNIVEIWAHVETEDAANPNRYFKATVTNREWLKAVLPGMIAIVPDDPNLANFTWALAKVLSSSDIIKFNSDNPFEPKNQRYFNIAKVELQGVVEANK